MIIRENVQFPKLLETYQMFNASIEMSEGSAFSYMDACVNEAKAIDPTNEFYMTAFLRMMLYLCNVPRKGDHILLRKIGVAVPNDGITNEGGGKKRKLLRHFIKWMVKNYPEVIYNVSNFDAFVNFSELGSFLHNEVKTNPESGMLLGYDSTINEGNIEIIAKLYGYLYNKYPEIRGLLAKHFPKLYFGKYRAKKIKIKSRDKNPYSWRVPFKYNSYVKLNGKEINDFKTNDNRERYITVNHGDIITLQRAKTALVLKKEAIDYKFAIEFSKNVGFEIIEKDGRSIPEGYIAFRKTQNTIEQKLSRLKNMTEPELLSLFDKATGEGRRRVSKLISYIDPTTKKQVAKPGWEYVTSIYVKWVEEQAKIAEQLRIAAANGNAEKVKELVDKSNIKTTGLSTVDLFYNLFHSSGMSETEINATYDMLCQFMNITSKVFVVLDESGSMNTKFSEAGVCDRTHKLANITFRQIARALMLAITTRNPEPRFRNTWAYFSERTQIAGTSQYVSDKCGDGFTENPLKKEYVNTTVSISASNSFSQNLEILKKLSPSGAPCTNLCSFIEMFVDGVKKRSWTVEQLPNCIYVITDLEQNTGKPISEGMKYAASIGWFPAIVYHCLAKKVRIDFLDVENAIVMGGVEESTLSDILQFINKGKICHNDVIWGIYDNPRHQTVNFSS